MVSACWRAVCRSVTGRTAHRHIGDVTNHTTKPDPFGLTFARLLFWLPLSTPCF
jgi:hypothetical protein